MDDARLEGDADAVAQAFGALIRRHRTERRISQSRLAEIVGMNRRYIIELEKGKATTQLGPALVIARAVGVPVEHLLGSAPQAPVPATPYDDDLPDLEDGHGDAPRIL